MRRICSLIVVVILTIMSASASAQMSFDEVKKCVEAIKIDGFDVFPECEEGTFAEDTAYTKKGIIVFTFVHYRDIMCGIAENGTRNNANTWGKRENGKGVDLTRSIVEVLNPLVDSYTNYNDGAKLTFLITSISNAGDPLIQLEYSPSISSELDHEDKTLIALIQYKNLDLFLDAVDFFTTQITNQCEENVTGDDVRAECKLVKGSKGSAVKMLQNKLNELGYSIGKADGDYGNKTVNAVSEFQRDNGLTETGEADIETLTVIFSDADCPIGTAHYA